MGPNGAGHYLSGTTKLFAKIKSKPTIIKHPHDPEYGINYEPV